MKLDPTGYMMLTLAQRAEVDAWVAENGFVLRDVISYELLDDDSVLIVRMDRSNGQAVHVDPDDPTHAATVRVTIRPVAPPPHFNRERRAA